jgi:hypothetical protein
MGSPFDMNQFNLFLENANAQILCGAECQQKKESETLRQNYLNAQVNVQTAPNQLNQAKKDWITFSQGAPAYRQMQTTDFTQEAQAIIADYKNNFNKEVNESSDNIATYFGVFNNCANVYDLYLKYMDENTDLKKMLKSDDEDVNTNNRKTYYENQEVETQENVSKILFFIYVITVIGYVCFALIYPSNVDWKIKVTIFLFLLIQPFISSYLVSGIVWIFQKIYGIFPKNVYIDL